MLDGLAEFRVPWDRFSGEVSSLLRVCLMSLAAILLSGCATIIHGSKERVEVQSEPSGAKVEVDGRPAGTTPVTIRLRRDASHTIRLYKDLHEPREISIRRKISWWSYLNVLNLYVPGALVDVITGAFYGLAPDQVSATLEGTAEAEQEGTDAETGGRSGGGDE